MIMVHVYAHIKPEFVEAFKAACIENGSHSIQEPGIALGACRTCDRQAPCAKPPGCKANEFEPF